MWTFLGHFCKADKRLKCMMLYLVLQGLHYLTISEIFVSLNILYILTALFCVINVISQHLRPPELTRLQISTDFL